MNDRESFSLRSSPKALVCADTTGEPDETVILTVTGGTGYNAVSPTAATGTILNDDTQASVGVSPASVARVTW